MDDIVKEFLTETRENLDQFDRDLVALEKDPASREPLASIFRTIHTLKGTCAFLAFTRLEALAHAAENLLSVLRDGRLTVTTEIVSTLLATGDTIRIFLAGIEATGSEGLTSFASLIERFTKIQNGASVSVAPAGADVSVTSPTAQPAEASVRVSVALLDQLMDIVGELVLTRNQILQCAADLAHTLVTLGFMKNNQVGKLQSAVARDN